MTLQALRWISAALLVPLVIGAAVFAGTYLGAFGVFCPSWDEVEDTCRSGPYYVIILVLAGTAGTGLGVLLGRCVIAIRSVAASICFFVVAIVPWIILAVS